MAGASCGLVWACCLLIFAALTTVATAQWNVGAAAANAGGALAAEKEACFACEFVTRKAYYMVKDSPTTDPSSIAEEYALALSASCSSVSTALRQGCATIEEQKDAIAADYARGSTFTDMCANAQLCWSGIYS